MICYINLDRSTMRRQWMESQMAQLGVRFERISAVDGFSLNPSSIKNTIIQGHRAECRLSATELGCFLSHREAWKRISSSSEEFGVVLEDDILLSSKVQLFLNDFSWIPRRTVLIRLETTRKRERLRKRQECGTIHDIPYTLHEFKGSYGSGAYILHKEMARWLIKNTKKICRTVDMELIRPDLFRNSQPSCNGGVYRFQLVPALAIQQHCTIKKFLPNEAEMSTMVEQGRLKDLPNDLRLKRELLRVFDANHWRWQLNSFRTEIPFLE